VDAFVEEEMRVKSFGLSWGAKSSSKDWLFLDSPGISEVANDLKLTQDGLP